MPWKNGLGLTSEIEISPGHSSLQALDFLWRFSSAEVGASSNFSIFKGYDRCLAVIEGDGLQLNEKFLGKNQVHRFSGEDEIHCAPVLKDGAARPIIDLGIIYQRDKCIADMEILQLNPSSKFTPMSVSSTQNSSTLKNLIRSHSDRTTSAQESELRLYLSQGINFVVNLDTDLILSGQILKAWDVYRCQGAMSLQINGLTSQARIAIVSIQSAK